MLQSNYSPRTTASTLDKDILSELQAVKRRIWWPIGIILGQATLLSLAWGFFYAVRTQGQIPLDPTTQYLVHLHPQCKTYLVTFVAT
ncbi:hypothetical protein FB45DRAFT_1027534 [Roridomyces roridus]|uniref:Uncharacterized protein n=1 Tax=Roridomyces roridus TaxID=1738132 RepID=A0AAD7FP36_9AGAR|nr:hypothetical protein FB45DRAFT_1027534 [Roridomyces roridus]